MSLSAHVVKTIHAFFVARLAIRTVLQEQLNHGHLLRFYGEGEVFFAGYEERGLTAIIFRFEEGVVIY